MLPKWVGEIEYAPATWDEKAYAKSFEKFFYRTPMKNIAKNLPTYWEFATWATKKEYSYMRGTTMLPMVATEKNQESTPSFPKCLFFKTEADYIERYGYEKYVEEWLRIKTGARPTPLWYMFLKKEILKKKKIKENDIRQILCSDPAYARIGLMFEQHQNMLAKDLTEHQHGQCGWTPFQGGWNLRMERLEKPGATYIEMDWSRFDGTIPPEVFLHIKNIRFGFLASEYRTRENRAIYRWYVDNLVNRYVLLPSGEITKQNRGNPSGQVSTTIDNNMVNTFLQAFEFMYVNKLNLQDAKKLWSEYDTIVYGDDRITRTPIAPEDYTEKVINMYAEIFGMWVKPENVKISKTLEGLSFCGFTNMRIKNMYLPVPTNVQKLIAGLVTPTRKLPDLDSLYGKVLSFKVLMHNLPDEDPGKNFILACEVALRRHIENAGQQPVKFTDSMLDFLWRGGPR
uniref:Non-structural polyprotein 1AB n=1 Tax=Mops bat astrovirus TaxID=3141890 RepID=A0AAU7E288_9VIRU